MITMLLKIVFILCTPSELLQNDNVSFECTNSSTEIDFIRTEKDPLIPSSTPIQPENIPNESVFVTPSKITNVKHRVPWKPPQECFL